MISRVLAILALCLTIASALTSNSGVEASRRAFLGTSSLAFLVSLPAFADDVDNLSIPEPGEKSEEVQMEERLRRKAELQKKASKPVNFVDSLAAEKKKKAELTKSKIEKRNAMCEELGRGC